MTYGSFKPETYELRTLDRDTTVSDHPIDLHPETFFHIPGDGNWVDDLGNVVLDQNPNPVDMYAPGVAADTTVSYFHNVTGGARTDRWTDTGHFNYSPPTTTGIGDFTAAHLYLLPANTTITNNVYTMTIKDSNAGANYGISMGIGSSNFRLVYGPTVQIIAGGVVANFQWHHFCATISGTEGVDDWTVKAYVDGVQVGSTLTNRPDITTPKGNIRLHLGSFAGQDAFRSRGAVRSFIGIRKALSDAEVAQLSTLTIGSP